MKLDLLTQRRLASRLAISFGSLTLWALLLGVTGWWSVTAIDARMKQSFADLEAEAVAHEIKEDLDDELLNVWSYAVLQSEPERRERAVAIARLRSSADQRLAGLLSVAPTEEARRLLGALSGHVQTMRQLSDRVMNLAGAGKHDEATRLCASEGRAAGEKVDAAARKVQEFHRHGVAKAKTTIATQLTTSRVTLAGLGLAALVVATFFGVVVARSITAPMAEAVGLMERISDGDLTGSVSPSLRSRRDEMGDLARAIDAMSRRLREVFGEVSQTVATLAGASEEMTQSATSSATNVRSTSEKATTVAAAAEEMSANAISVANGMALATDNLATVATATEEMTSTIGEIAGNSERARAITAEATQQARQVTASMQELNRAAQAIGKVTETITTISDQTKLLALNATIEAARAGAAGKGFAVVAHEIKELARQTAEATEDIRSKIEGIQTSTTGTFADLERIAAVIEQVSENVNSTASAIEEQSIVTKDIARNVAEAVTGVKEANDRVAEISSVSQTVARDIATVNHAAGEIASGSEQVLTSAAELARLAEELRGAVARFRTESGERSPESAPGPARARPPATRSHREGGRKFIEWTEEWSVGVEAMDAHHRKLVDLINDLHAAMRSGQGRAAIGPALEELARYTEYHFGAEEKLMTRHRCSNLAEQKTQHANFLRQVAELQRKFQAGQHGLGPEVLTTLKDWLVGHIVRKDRPCMAEVCDFRHRHGRPAGNGVEAHVHAPAE